MGDKEQSFIVDRNTTFVASAVIDEEFSGFAFITNSSIYYWVVFDIVSLPVNFSTLDIYDFGETPSYTLQIHDQSNFTIIFQSYILEAVEVIFELRQYDEVAMGELLYYAIGDLITKAAYFTIILYIVYRIFKPLRKAEPVIKQF